MLVRNLTRRIVLEHLLLELAESLLILQQTRIWILLAASHQTRPPLSRSSSTTQAPQPNNDTTFSPAEEPLQLRRSSRTSHPTERARGSFFKPKSSRSSVQQPSAPSIDAPSAGTPSTNAPSTDTSPIVTPSIDKSLLLRLPKDVAPQYTSIVNSAGLGESWDACIARWLLVESQSKQVSQCSHPRA